MASQPLAGKSRSMLRTKPIVVGLYGISGCGKTFLLDELKQWALAFESERFEFFEGSKMIVDVAPGGLEAFQHMSNQEKIYWRTWAIDVIAEKCADSDKVGVVAGHFMFWPEEQDTGQEVRTEKDLATFTHILYMNAPPEVVAEHRTKDKNRSRPIVSVAHLKKWQEAERTRLLHLCSRNRILFSLVSSPSMHLMSRVQKPTLLHQVSRLLDDFSRQTEEYNLDLAGRALDQARFGRQIDTVLVLDADKTLTAEDTGALFWGLVSKWSSWDETSTLSDVFSSPLGYSYLAFRQAALLYEEAAGGDDYYDQLYERVASSVTIHPEFINLLRQVKGQNHVAAVIMTCAPSRTWKMILKAKGLWHHAAIIGGGRIQDDFVVTPAVKAALVSRLRNMYQKYVWAFGESPLDLDMLKQAHEAIIVVGEEQTRSKSMDAALNDAIENHGLRARQLLLPSSTSPRLDITKLPLVQLTDEFIGSIFRRPSPDGLQILHATDKMAAKLLMTPMRDTNNTGPVLREAPRRVGWHIATEYLVDAIGLEEYQIQQVQGYQITGHRLLQGSQTSIVALMRGGEPMALGVNDAFPLATFVHAGEPAHIGLQHLHAQGVMVLLDSVISSGKTVVGFVEHVRNTCPSIRILVVVGVAHAQINLSDSPLQMLSRRAGFTIIALRLSKNKFIGSGVTDTGNRLFNTTHLQ